MTAEEAIEILANEMPCCGEKVVYSEGERCEAYAKAISALRAQLKQGADKSPCDGCDCGWGTISSNWFQSCHDTCEKLAAYHAQQQNLSDVSQGFSQTKPMTLDDAIAHLNDTLASPEHEWSCEECRQEHMQLRAWLIELRNIKQQPNAPLTMDDLQEMVGEPVWCAELQCYGIIKVETIGRWANIPFLVGAWRGPNCGSAVNFEYDIESRGLTLYRYKPEEGTV